MNIKLKTRTKLIVMAGIPTIALLYFSISGTFEKAMVASNMAKLESLVSVSVKIGALAHELQKERGMSAGFIGSKGVKFAAELPAQRAETDKRANGLHATLKDFDLSQYDGSLKTALDDAQGGLGEIGTKRNDISALSIDGAASAGYYTKTIGIFLQVPGMVSTLSTQSEISRLASAYKNLLEAKERAGRERAILSGVFAADKFTSDALTKYLMNSAAQDTFNTVFLNYALESQKAFYKDKMMGQAVDEVARLKKLAIDKASDAKLGVDPTYWFKMATDRINLLKEVEDKLSGDLLSAADRLKSEARSTMIIYITLTIVSILLTFIFAFFLIRDLLRQLGGEPEYAAASVHTIAAGDLTSKLEVKAGDTSSMMYSLQVMQDSLRKIVADIKASVDLIDNSSKEIAQGNTDLSSRTEEQAASLEETAASMEELTSTVKQNAENARQANQLARSASEIALKGGAVVGEVVGTMSSINESSRKIVDIISVIDGIAFQTNILALNAAVEAARAGEQGRGFAVVAAEVRNLAQRSAAAAKEIKALIGSSVEKVEDGTKLVDNAGKTMEEIVNAVKRVTDIMAEISAASNEQSTGIEQINQAITQMDEVTQSNAALVEEAAAAAESLEDEAQHLSQSVSVFKLDDSSSAQPQARRAPAARPAAPHPAPPAHKPAPKHGQQATPAKRLADKPKVLAKKEGGEEKEWAEF